MKLTADEMRLINFFEAKTKTKVVDCLIEGDDITIIVDKGYIGFAIGKNGSIINKIKKEIGKEIHVYEFDKTPEGFIKNLLYPLKVNKIEINGSEAKVYIDPKHKKRAIGKEGKKINQVKKIVGRHYKINKITVM